MTADEARITSNDVTELNRTTVEATASITGRAGTVLILVAGVAVAAWVWIVARQQQLLGGDGSFLPFGSSNPDVSFAQRIDLVANSIGYLATAALVGGLGFGLRLAAEFAISRTGGSLTGLAVGGLWPDDDEDEEDDQDLP